MLERVCGKEHTEKMNTAEQTAKDQIGNIHQSLDRQAKRLASLAAHCEAKGLALLAEKCQACCEEVSEAMVCLEDIEGVDYADRRTVV